MKKSENKKYVRLPKEANREHIHKYKIAHMVGVAEYMRENCTKYGLEDIADKDQLYTIGLLHDIGYLEGRQDHEKSGADMLEKMDIKPLYREAILLHGKTPKDAAEYYNISIEELEFKNPVLLLLWEADMKIDAAGYNVGYYGRLNDIGERYGYDHIAYKTASDVVTYLKHINMLNEIREEHIPGVDIDKVYSPEEFLSLCTDTKEIVQMYDYSDRHKLNPMYEYVIVDHSYYDKKGEKRFRYSIITFPEHYNKDKYHQIKYHFAYRRGYKVLEKLAKNMNYYHYEIVKDTNYYDYGLTLIEYHDEAKTLRCGDDCIDLVEYMKAYV